MILRRVIELFRKQEWTAIFIDFVIVVAGVFVGIQASNWNGARLARAEERGYLERLLADARANAEELQDAIAAHRARAETLRALTRALETGAAAPSQDSLQAALCRWFIQPLPALRSETYDELVSSGELTKLRDGDLRALLARARAAHAEAARLDIVTPAVQRAAAPLDAYRQWYIPEGAEQAERSKATDCRFDLVGMRADPQMTSVIAQLYRDERNHQYFRSVELEATRAVLARLEADVASAGERTGRPSP